MIGVNLAGAEFGSGRGVYGTDYIYPTTSVLDYYERKGVELVRLPFTWERMQPTLGGPLDPAELSRLQSFLTDAAAHGMQVVLDLHNYGRYDGAVIGSAAVPVSAFQEFWGALAAAVQGYPAVHGYGLMNEPHDMGNAHVWPDAAQAAVDAIRAVDSQHTIIVAGDSWSGARQWQEANPYLSINDPADNLLYEAHVYFDRDGSGTYRGSFDEEGATTTTGVERVQPFLDWLDQHGARGFIGEYGVPNDDPRWLDTLDTFLDALDANGIPSTYWAGGDWWGDYKLAIAPRNGEDAPQMDVLEQHIAQPADQVGDPPGSELAGVHLTGGADTDTLIGGRHGDMLAGGDGNDHLYGYAGDDVIGGQNGDDNIYGGGGHNKLYGDAGNDHIIGGSGDDVIDGGAGNDVIDTGSGNNYVEARDGDDTVTGGIGNDIIGGQDGNDFIAGGAGDDKLYGDTGDDIIGGQDGNDLISGGSGNDHLWGDAGDDIVNGDDGDDQIDGGDGNDQLHGDAGRDIIHGAAGDDKLFGGDGDDSLFGDDGDDVINADAGSDIAHGGAGNDWIAGGDGNDQLFGDDGDDIIGGQGGDDLIVGGNGADKLYGDAGNDIIGGQAGNDFIVGGDGDDKLYGDDGDDIIIGGSAGNDLIDGGSGNDILWGDAGADVFQFNAMSGRDVIKDFDASQGDRLVLNGASYTLQDSQDGVTLSMSDGSSILLEHVQISAFHSDWVLF